MKTTATTRVTEAGYAARSDAAGNSVTGAGVTGTQRTLRVTRGRRGAVPGCAVADCLCRR